jgi:hypothetical protein
MNVNSAKAGEWAPPKYHWTHGCVCSPVSPQAAGPVLQLPSLGYNIETVSCGGGGEGSPEFLLLATDNGLTPKSLGVRRDQI